LCARTKILFLAQFEVLTLAVLLKSQVFWDMMLCWSVNV